MIFSLIRVVIYVTWFNVATRCWIVSASNVYSESGCIGSWWKGNWQRLWRIVASLWHRTLIYGLKLTTCNSVESDLTARVNDREAIVFINSLWDWVRIQLDDFCSALYPSLWTVKPWYFFYKTQWSSRCNKYPFYIAKGFRKSCPITE